MFYKGKEYYTLNRWVSIFNEDYKKRGINIDKHKLWILFSYYKLRPIYKNDKYPIFSVNDVMRMRTQNENFIQILMRINNGEKPSKKNIIKNFDANQNDNDKLTYINNENDMEKYSKYLINKYQIENKNKIHQIISESINDFIRLDEINHIANNSPITVCSYDDFCEICENQLNVSDSNVDNLIGKFCFIEIGSTRDRCNLDYTYTIGYEKYKDSDDYFNHQFYFKKDHTNVLRLTFDDNMQMLSKKQPVKLSKGEVKPEYWVDKKGKPMSDNAKKCVYYDNGKGFDMKMAKQATLFIEDNVKNSKGDLKFVIHCRAGASRSAAFGFHIANLIKTDLNKYLSEYEYDNPDGTRTSQFNISWSPKYDKDGNLTYDKNGNESGKRRMMNHRVYGMLTKYISDRNKLDKNGLDFSEEDLNNMGKKSTHPWMRPYVNYLTDYMKKNKLSRRQK